MNLLTPRELELVALGAALGSNCASCVEHHVGAARQAGLDEAQIGVALAAADQIRQVPAQKALDAAHRALERAAPAAGAAAEPCPCAGIMATACAER
ncbi:MAG: hypothetical protein A3H93_02155 [Rhodocyclales bacterium RIFCSPLOWO2_02_FULL_63_24]|nr:MAG: hypothetical protein A3H93_02155 [Rhodocyclales bacterium RIFCSPLOWO2_02_FULL_63_24]